MVDSATLTEAIATTMITSGSATLLATIIGVPLGALCARRTARWLTGLRTVIIALYGLPPVVVGVFVYSLLSRSGPLGNLDLLFTVEAMVMAQTVLILPLVWGGSWSAFSQVEEDVGDVLETMGVGTRQRFLLEVSLARSGVYHAVVLAFGRAIAEVGAVIMVGGNIAGKTRVMTTSIVLETSKGNLDEATVLGVLLLLFSLTLIALASFLRDWRPTPTATITGADAPLYPSYDGAQHRTITVQRHGAKILDEVEVVLKPGTILAVVGESGAGKSTLLRALAGLEHLQQTTGPFQTVYVPQRAKPLKVTVAQEIGLAASCFASLTPVASYFLRRFDLEHLQDAPTLQLSGGELQRVVLARQLGLHPQLLLLDEGMANLGYAHTKSVEKELRILAACGACVVMVTHNVLQAKRMADEMLILHKGRRLSSDDPLAVELLTQG